MPKLKTVRNNNGSANLGFEETLWAAADKLRSNMDAADYKHVVLGLIFLKYISDAFSERYRQLLTEVENIHDPVQRKLTLEDRDEYTAENVFWVPLEARWEKLQAAAKRPEIGRLIDDAMTAIENENPRLKGVLPKNYARADLDKTRLGELVDLIGTIGLGDPESQRKDILGRVYEYFLGKFASAEGKAGGQFYTPACVVKLLVAMIEPYVGRVYDPCCGSGGMFVQSERFVQEHGGKIGDISIYGQESNPTTWRLAKMNLAIRGIEADLGLEPADTFTRDLHPDLRANYILANPPFNMSDWGGERLSEDTRWKYGMPPTGNANYAWIQHKIYHLSPRGYAGFVLANGSLTSNTAGEGDIRKRIIDADLIDCVISLPAQLFYSTQIPASLWFISKDKSSIGKLRERHGQTLFIDARKLGTMRDRIHNELLDSDIDMISSIYHRWREMDGNYTDIPGLCKSVNIQDIRQHKYALVPGRYVGFNRDFIYSWNHETLRNEILEIEARLSAVNQASNRALSVLKELLNG